MLGSESGCAYWPKRYIIFFLIFLSMLFFLGSMSSFGFAITCMANQTKTMRIHNERCSIQLENMTDHGYAAEFDWSTDTQGDILSAASWGMMIGSLLSWLPDKYGSKWLYLTAGILCAAADISVPFVAHNVVAVIFLRILQGIGPGLCWGVLMQSITVWATQNEIGLMFGSATSGAFAGPLLNFATAGEICATVGWRVIFYLWGSLTAIWCFVWFIIYSDSVDEARFNVSLAEKELIAAGKKFRKIREPQQRKNIPFRKIFGSSIVWILVFLQFAVNVFMYFLEDFIPTYFKMVLYLPSNQNGLASCLPMLGLVIGRNIAGYLSDRQNCLSLTSSAKVFSAIGLVGPAILLLGVSRLDCTHSGAAIALTFLASLSNAMCGGGYMKTIPYIAPSFVSTVSMVAMVAASLGGIVVPLIAPTIMPDYSLQQWQRMFYVVTAVLMAAAALYVVFGTAVCQDWGMELPLVIENAGNETGSYDDGSYKPEKLKGDGLVRIVRF